MYANYAIGRKMGERNEKMDTWAKALVLIHLIFNIFQFDEDRFQDSAGDGEGFI